MKLSDLLSLFKRKGATLGKAPAGGQCCLCRQTLSGRVREDAWGNRAHAEHRIAFCSSCDRLLSAASSAGAYRYSDGRFICGFCKKSAVNDSVAANLSRRRVQHVLEAKGFAGIPKGIKVVLAHPKTLSAHSRKRNTAGLTLSHYHFSNYKRVGITHEIGILYGLPRLEFEGVLAHELLHVWQHEHEIKFSAMYCEGLCELGAYLIYSEAGGELGKHFLKKMKDNRDPVYGNGYRLMLQRLEKLGWKALLEEILKNKRGLEASVMKKIFGKKQG